MAGDAYDPAMAVYVEPVLAWKRETGILIAEREIRLVNTEHGFAGTADVMFRYGENGIGILDYKTRKTEPGKAVGAYEDQAMQLAALCRDVLGRGECRPGVGGECVYQHDGAGASGGGEAQERRADWQAFKMIAAIWRYLKGYDPRSSAEHTAGPGPRTTGQAA